jgi:hypothetical protein
MIVVQSLWVGDALSPVERTVIASHLQRGHQFHLYTYGPVANVPTGTVVKDGREILPASEIFCYQRGAGKGSVSAFSNCFRYKLLAERGNWWVDMDVVCLLPFDFAADYVFAGEKRMNGTVAATTCVMRAPQGSPLMSQCFARSWAVDRATVEWGQIGPALLNTCVNELGLQRYVMPSTTFCPLHTWQVQRLFDVSNKIDITHSHAIHLWNEMWRSGGYNKFGSYPGQSLFSCLKRLAKIDEQPIDVHTLEMNFTNFCNLRCKNCCSAVGLAPSPGYMSMEVLRQWLRESRLLKWRWHLLKLWGGEPTLHPQFWQALDLVRKFGTRILLMTNGSGAECHDVLLDLPIAVEVQNTEKSKRKDCDNAFETMYMAPCDDPRYAFADYSVGCFRLQECGLGLSADGHYYPCGPGIHVARVFNLDIGLHSLAEVTEENLRAQLPALCSRCGLFKQPAVRSSQQQVSSTWRKALEAFGNVWLGQPGPGVVPGEP